MSFLRTACHWSCQSWIVVRTRERRCSLIIDKVPLALRYFSDVSFKLHISLYLSLGLNVIYAVMKFTFGLRYHSVWFGTLAVYYFLLAVMRFLLLHHANRKGFGTDRIGELQSYRLCGMILMVMNISLTGVVVLGFARTRDFSTPAI